MNRFLIVALMIGAPAALLAQSAIDAQQISQSDMKGTARFMSMGGAFTALGGDLSAINQNPAGVGIYRSSEIGATLDIDLQSAKTSPSFLDAPSSTSQTKVYCNNFGYVGATNISGSALRTFNWGVTFNRAASFDRHYRGYVDRTATSLSNYVAAFSQDIDAWDMEFDDYYNYNPYLDSDIDWMSILAYNAYLINPLDNNAYAGLYKEGTSSDALYDIRETGRVDEYNITFGGNVENVVYWGVNIGITDLNYTRTAYYSEDLTNANIHNTGTGNSTVTGTAIYDLNSRKYINGSGWNMKFGVILKPINELRVGLAFHTPTWYHLNQGYDGVIDYSYYNPTLPENYDDTTKPLNPLESYAETPNAYFQWRFRSPWKLTTGIAAVIGKKAIVSLDYQYDGFSDMSIATPYYYNDWGASDYETNEYLRSDIKQYFKGTSTVRLGVEYRVTPQFSVRAGYNFQTSGVRSEAANGQVEVLTSGVDLSYDFTKNIQHISCGIGYKYQNWYIDAAYVYRQRESRYHAFSDCISLGIVAPQSKLMEHNSQIVLSTGFKF